MNFEINRLSMEETEINIKRLVEQCVRSMRLILISIIIFAMLVPAVIYTIEFKKYNDESKLVGENEIELSASDKIVVDNYFALIRRLQQLEEHSENSKIINMDFNRVCQGNIQFYVDADDKVKNDIASAIATYLNSIEVAQELNKVDELVQPEYAYELIKATAIGDENGVPSGVVNLRVWAQSEEECVQYVECIKLLVYDFSASLQTKMEQCTLSVIQEYYKTGFVSDIYTSQKNFVKEWQNVSTELTNLEAMLTENQKMYIAQLEMQTDGVKEENAELTVPDFSVIWALVGAVLGLIIGLIIVFVRTMFSGTLQSEEELQRRLEVNSFGRLKYKPSSEFEKMVGGLLYSNIDNSIQIEMICTRIEQYVQSKSIGKIALISSTDILQNELIEELSNALESKKIKCTVIGNILKEKAALSKIADEDNLVMIEIIGKSKVKDVYEEAMLCDDLNIQVIGYIPFVG